MADIRNLCIKATDSTESAEDRLAKRSGPLALPRTAYDGVGNLVNHPDFRVFGYDGEGRMTSSSAGCPAISGSNGYDGDGRRVTKTVGSLKTHYLYDAFGRLAVEYGTTEATGTRYFTGDHLGLTRVVVDRAGMIKNCHDYLRFGEPVSVGRPACYGANMAPHTPPADGNRVHFTGKERDAETGLDYFGARCFSAAQGRWTSTDWSHSPEPVPFVDPGDSQTLNLYGYVRYNPLQLNDPYGHGFLEKAANWLTNGGWTDDPEKATANRAAFEVKLANQMAQDWARDHSNLDPSKYSQEQVVQAYRNGALSRTRDDPMDPSQLLGMGRAIPGPFPRDFPGKNQVNSSGQYQSEDEARAVARTKLGRDAVEVEPGKWRSRDGVWPYRAKRGDVADGHIHLEKLTPHTGEVTENPHLRWQTGTGR